MFGRVLPAEVLLRRLGLIKTQRRIRLKRLARSMTTPESWTTYVWLAAGGACGTLARYGLSRGADAWAETLSQGLARNLPGGLLEDVAEVPFPIGTLAVNLLGCFGFGLVVGLGLPKLGLPKEVNLVVLAGFMGAFTTFSTYAFEASAMAEVQRYRRLIAHLLLHNGLGLLLVTAGLLLGRWLSSASSPG